MPKAAVRHFTLGHRPPAATVERELYFPSDF